MRIEICGALGSGKSTLAQKLSAEMNWRLIEERVDQNPFLLPAYRAPALHSFEKSMFFLLDYIHQAKATANDNCVFDCSIVLQKSYPALSHFAPEEDAALQAGYAVADALPPPDLVIHLDYPVELLHERVRNRSRFAEFGVKPADEILQLQAEIAKHLKSLEGKTRILTLKAGEYDFVNNPADIQKLAAIVRHMLAPKTRRPAPPAPT